MVNMTDSYPIIVKRSQHNITRKNIDQDALKVLYRLHRHGYKAYLVGGAVRDLLLGSRPKDFDIVTDARPGEMKKLFGNAFLIGRRFRLVHVRFKGGKIIEVATFRREPHNDEEDMHNTFGTPEEDAFRRDITINGLFYNIADFSIIDYVGGLADINDRQVRVIGDPVVRYAEDPVRIWRVIRHAARNDFEIDAASSAAIADYRDNLSECAGSRLFEELNKDLKSGNFAPLFDRMNLYGIWPYLLGEIGSYLESHAAKGMLPAYDRCVRRFKDLSPEMMYCIFLWPWLEHVLENLDPSRDDPAVVLKDAMLAADMAVTMPKAIKAGVIQIAVIVRRMQAAMETGRMRWSLKKRARYTDAARVFSLLYEGRVVDGPDPFEAIFRMKYKNAPCPQRRRRSRRRPPAKKG